VETLLEDESVLVVVFDKVLDEEDVREVDDKAVGADVVEDPRVDVDELYVDELSVVLKLDMLVVVDVEPEPTLDAVLLEDEVADEDDVREVMELENVFEDVEEVVVRVDEVEEKLVVDDSVLVLDDLLVLVVLVVVLVSVFEVDVDVVDVAEYPE